MEFIFDDLLDTILDLFKIRCHRYDYDYLNRICGTFAKKEVQDRNIINAVGNMESFHSWLESKLVDFFIELDGFFQTDDARVNKLRYYPYKAIILKRGYETKCFRKKMANEIFLNISSMTGGEDGVFLGKNTSTEEGRRTIILNAIKNYVYRIFLINKCCE